MDVSSFRGPQKCSVWFLLKAQKTTLTKTNARVETAVQLFGHSERLHKQAQSDASGIGHPRKRR